MCSKAAKHEVGNENADGGKIRESEALGKNVLAVDPINLLPQSTPVNRQIKALRELKNTTSFQVVKGQDASKKLTLPAYSTILNVLEYQRFFDTLLRFGLWRKWLSPVLRI